MIKEAIGLLAEGRDLSEQMMVEVMTMIMGGKATPAQIGAFITALRMKGETVTEIVGAARVMRDHATAIEVATPWDADGDGANLNRETIVDTCGTGGSGTRSFNISTTVALVVAACGVRVAKHGNRSVSSACGSADVLEQLGVNLDVPPVLVAQCIERIGVGFLFAPALHGAMKHASAPRREIGIRTIFNILGPLTNPARANRQVLGVYRADLVEKLAAALLALGCRKGFVVHGSDGMDEITLTGPTTIAAIDLGGVTVSTIRPEQFGFHSCDLADLQGGDAAHNANIVRAILGGALGPQRDIVLLNSAYALMAAEMVETVPDGVAMAIRAIDAGNAAQVLAELVGMTNS